MQQAIRRLAEPGATLHRCTSLLTSPATRRPPPKCGAFPFQPRGSPLRQTGCWRKTDSNSPSHFRANTPAGQKAVRHQAPQAICEVKPMNGRANLLVTNAPPFDNPVLRRAMQLSLDRKSFIDILGEGQYDIGAVLQAPAGRHLGHAPRDAGAADGIWPRYRQEPRRGAGDDALTWLRSGQPA